MNPAEKRFKAYYDNTFELTIRLQDENGTAIPASTYDTIAHSIYKPGEEENPIVSNDLASGITVTDGNILSLIITAEKNKELFGQLLYHKLVFTSPGNKDTFISGRYIVLNNSGSQNDGDYTLKVNQDNLNVTLSLTEASVATASALGALADTEQLKTDTQSIADQALIDIESARTTALSNISSSETSAVQAVNDARDAGVLSVQNARDQGVGAVESARDTAVSTINGLVTQAETARDEAVTAKNTAETQAGIATTKAGEADTSATNASTSETNASASEAKSEKWAEENEDVEVETGKYSAKHHAAKADQSATQAATEVSNHAQSVGNHGDVDTGTKGEGKGLLFDAQGNLVESAEALADKTYVDDKASLLANDIKLINLNNVFSTSATATNKYEVEKFILRIEALDPIVEQDTIALMKFNRNGANDGYEVRIQYVEQSETNFLIYNQVILDSDIPLSSDREYTRHTFVLEWDSIRVRFTVNWANFEPVQTGNTSEFILDKNSLLNRDKVTAVGKLMNIATEGETPNATDWEFSRGVGTITQNGNYVNVKFDGDGGNIVPQIKTTTGFVYPGEKIAVYLKMKLNSTQPPHGQDEMIWRFRNTSVGSSASFSEQFWADETNEEDEDFEICRIVEIPNVDSQNPSEITIEGYFKNTVNGNVVCDFDIQQYAVISLGFQNDPFFNKTGHDVLSLLQGNGYLPQEKFIETVADKAINVITPWTGKKLVTIGDSITGTLGWQPYLASWIGMNWSEEETRDGINGNDPMAVGGSKIVPVTYGSGDSSTNQISQSIYIRARDAVQYSPDVIILFAGGNDLKIGDSYNASQDPIADYGVDDAPYTGDGVDLTVDAGAVVPSWGSVYKGIIKQLQEDMPFVKIFCVTPVYHSPSMIEEIQLNTLSPRLLMNEAGKEIALRYGCEWIDLQQASGINQYNYKEFLQDLAHPEYWQGGRRFAEAMYRYF